MGKAAGSTSKGVIIGAVIGGAAGAVIGRQMDQKAEELEAELENAEVERVGEGQRFLTRTMTEANSRALGAGQQPMEPVAMRDRETVHARPDRGTGR